MILKRVLKSSTTAGNIIRTFSNLVESTLKPSTINNEQIKTEDHNLTLTSGSVLEELSEDISHVSPYLKPSFNFAAYINKSATLQELLKLGVDLYRIEKNVEAVSFILGLKFDDIKEHIIFLKNIGLATDKIGAMISKNPFVLREELENLKVRINYLQFKKFTDDMILRIIERNPFWLTYSTQDIDERLGFFQNHFSLKGNEVRFVAVRAPKLITFDVNKLKINTFALKEEMGFSQDEIKHIILSKPTILYRDQKKILKTFEYLHKTMNISMETILQTPEVLTCRHQRLIERHLFLVKVGRAQYDPKKPNYVALTTLVSGTDSHFSTEIAKSSIQAYNGFLKSL